MKTIKHVVLVTALVGAVSASPALAGGWNLWGGFQHHGGSSSSTGGASTGGSSGRGGSSTSGGSSSGGGSGSGGATPVPEPADAALFALGIAGVALGRRFRPRKKG